MYEKFMCLALCSAMAAHIRPDVKTLPPTGKFQELRSDASTYDQDIHANEEDPKIILRQSKYSQDMFISEYEPLAYEFGHVMEQPNLWEQRIEKRNMNTQRHQGKVRWGDKDGMYGEHYWDFNHHNITDNDDGGNDHYLIGNELKKKRNI